ncbi:hypothetical protein FGB62_15g03 [Gracilaria domingensis]|nr:hypothetical protein FGB62_15g03 [Gracilaria domingensis]
MVGPNLKRNAVASWLFQDRTSDIPIEYAQIVANDGEMQVEFRPGNTMDCEEALKFFLQKAVKGAYDNTTARYEEDKDDLNCMANSIFHIASGEDFGKVAYDLDYSDYDQLFQTLSTGRNPESVWLPLYRSERTYDSTMPGVHTMYPTYISSFVDPESSTCAIQWLPKHCRYFRTPSEPAGGYDIWIHFESHGTFVAVIAMAVIIPRPCDTEKSSSHGRLYVKILQTKEIASGTEYTKAYGVDRVIDLWDCRVPILLRDVLRMLEG